MIGPLIVVVGALFLLSNLGLISPVTWSIIWPIVVILIGLSMMRKHGRWGRHCWCGCGKDCNCKDEEKAAK